MGFKERLAKAQQFEQEVEQYCCILAQAVAKNGSEHTHPDFVNLIRNYNDPGAKLVRFEPDGIFLSNNKVWHWEAKRAKSIEKDAYNTYLAYENLGCSVLIFFKHPNGNKVFWNYISNIGFLDSVKVISKYTKYVQPPIDDFGWIYPRLSSYFVNFGSGTPYKEINFDTLKEIPNFYETIKNNLMIEMTKPKNYQNIYAQKNQKLEKEILNTLNPFKFRNYLKKKKSQKSLINLLNK